MKMMRLLLVVGLGMGAAGCDRLLDTEPPNGMSPEVALNTIEGLQAATNGNYRRMMGIDQHRITEFGADEVAYCCTTTSALYNLYTYIHAPNLSNVAGVWRTGYAAIYGANQVIGQVQPGTSAAYDQLLGENYFLRAWWHFFLVRVFGRPYPQGRDNPGVPIRLTVESSELPERATVGAVYDQVVADLLKAAELMTQAKTNPFASKEVAYALLSRVYLYMQDNEKAIQYANLVITSTRYSLPAREVYMTWPKRPPEQNPEIIWAVKYTVADDAGSGNPGYIYYRTAAGVGYGEMQASMMYWTLLNQHPNDARLAFIEPQRDTLGNIVPRLGVPQLFPNKMIGQEGIATLGSPVILRLAEMYLNRAEANAKLGHADEAIADVNVIRARAGLTDTAQYSAADLKGHATVLDVVLEERLMELAFEGHRQYDLFRNNRPMIRDYPGTHLIATAPGVDLVAKTQVVLPTDPWVIYYIPETEIQLNPKLTQNP